MIDVVSTYCGLKTGIIAEVNPFMGYFLEINEELACLGVLAGVGIALCLIYKFRARAKWIPSAVRLILGAKLAVILVHFQWIYVLIQGLKKS